MHKADGSRAPSLRSLIEVFFPAGGGLCLLHWVLPPAQHTWPHALPLFPSLPGSCAISVVSLGGLFLALLSPFPSPLSVCLCSNG